MPSANEEFRDFLLQNSHAQHQFENGVVRSVGSHYDLAKLRLHDEISRLEQYGTGFTREWRLQRLQNIMGNVEATMAGATGRATTDLTGSLELFGSVQADAVHGQLQDIVTRVGTVMNRLPTEQVAEIVKSPMLLETYPKRLAHHSAEAIRTIRGRLAQAIITGEDMRTARNYLLGRGVGWISGRFRNLRL